MPYLDLRGFMLIVFAITLFMLFIYFRIYFLHEEKSTTKENSQNTLNSNYISYSNILFDIIGAIYIIYLSINVTYFNLEPDNFDYILVIILIEYLSIFLVLLFFPIISIAKKKLSKIETMILVFILMSIVITYYSEFLKEVILNLYSFNYNLLILFFGSVFYLIVEILKNIFNSYEQTKIIIKTNLILMAFMFISIFISITFVATGGNIFFSFLSLWYFSKIIIEVMNISGKEI